MSASSNADGAASLTNRVQVPAGARLVLATHNAGKLAELRQILTPLVPGLVPESVISAASLQAPGPVEDGLSFADNALLKARALAQATGLPAAASFTHVSPAGAALGLPLADTLKKMYFVEDTELSPLACAYARARGADRMSSLGDWIVLSDEFD